MAMRNRRQGDTYVEKSSKQEPEGEGIVAGRGIGIGIKRPRHRFGGAWKNMNGKRRLIVCVGYHQWQVHQLLAWREPAQAGPRWKIAQ